MISKAAVAVFLTFHCVGSYTGSVYVVISDWYYPVCTSWFKVQKRYIVKITDIGLSDRSLVSCRLVDEILLAPIATAVYRSWKQLDVDCFRQKILSSSLYQKPADTVNA